MSIELTPQQKAEKAQKEAEQEQKEIDSFWSDVREVEVKHKRLVKAVIMQDPGNGALLPQRYPLKMSKEFLKSYEEQHKKLNK